MERLTTILNKHATWSPLVEYERRIEGYKSTDFSICIENAKALLESIAKEICDKKNQPLRGNENVNRLLTLAFGCLGYQNTNTVTQIGGAIANVAQQMGNFRNEIGATAHGRTLEELQQRNDSLINFTGEFLLNATELVCCFLIEAYETGLVKQTSEEIEITYEGNAEFNLSLDELYGEFEIGEYSYVASEILYNVDPAAYKTELNSYITATNEADNRE